MGMLPLVCDEGGYSKHHLPNTANPNTANPNAANPNAANPNAALLTA